VAKRLDRLNGANSSGIAFQKLWQRNCELIEAQFNDLFQALAVGKEIMPTLPAVTINADYTGAVMPSNQLPKTILCTRFNGTTDVTALSTWSAVARIGGATATINSATGALQLTAITGSDIVDVTSVRDVEGVSMTLTQPQQFLLRSGGGSDRRRWRRGWRRFDRKHVHFRGY
jgi:hypothetical protein